MIQSSASSERGRFFFFGILVIVVVLVYCTSFPRLFSASLWPDEALYAWLAKKAVGLPQVLLSREYVERQPPLFPALLSLAHFCPVSFDLALRFLTLLIGVSGIIAFFYVGRLIGGSDFIAGFCAVGVGFSPAYFSYLPRILADNTQMMFFLLFILALYHAREKASLLADCRVGILGACLIFIKWSGALCLPIMALCYLVSPDPKSRGRLLVPAGMTVAALALLLGNNFVQFGSVLPNLTALQGALFPGPPWFYLQHFRLLSIFPGGVYLVFIGLLMLWLIKHPQRVMISLWFVSTFLAVSLAGEKDIRYAFLFLPAAVLLIGILLNYLIERFVGKGKWRIVIRSIVCAIFLLFSFQLILKQQPMVVAGDHSYVGFKEAGEFIRSLNDPQLNVYADSDRAIRYYSSVQYREYGGKLSILPRSLKDLEAQVRSGSGKSVVVVDRWEYTQPQWAFPFNAEKLAILDQAGFRLVYVVHQPVMARSGKREGLVSLPVIWIFSLKEVSG